MLRYLYINRALEQSLADRLVNDLVECYVVLFKTNNDFPKHSKMKEVIETALRRSLVPVNLIPDNAPEYIQRLRI